MRRNVIDGAGVDDPASTPTVPAPVLKPKHTVLAWLGHTATIVLPFLIPALKALVLAHPAIAAGVAIGANTLAALAPGSESAQ